MTAQIQLDMFREITESDLVQAKISELKESQDKIRKRLFAQQKEMMKIILQQQEELDCIKTRIGISFILEKNNV